MTMHRMISLIVIVLAALIGGTLAAGKVATDYLLHQNATQAASQWARYLAENVGDLEQIADGQQPSSGSMAFFQWSLRVGSVFRYEIYNRHGYSQLVSDQRQIALVDLSEFSTLAAAAAKTGEMSAAVKEGGEQPDLPAFFGEAYVPVAAGGQTIAVVAAYVDQTAERGRYYNSFLLAAGGLSALTSLSFLIPAAAWYRRTIEKDRVHAELRFLAKHDAMTRLPNRAHLAERLADTLAHDARTNKWTAIHYLDLDHFKDVNDRFGHQAGDTVIRLMGDRIRGATRSHSDIVARMGGDEFIVVQAGISEQSEAEKLAARLLETMSHPFPIQDRTITTTVSIGIALAPGDGRDPDRLIHAADLALYTSKAAGKNCFHFFTPELDAELQVRQAIETRMRHAAEDGKFELYYQPIVDLTDETVIGYEALLRLHDDRGEPIAPSEFIPIAEQMGLIHKIGAGVLRQACLTAAGWPERLKVSVNLSVAQFDGSVRNVVCGALAEAGLDPARLELEITESLLMGGAKSVMDELAALKALGVAIVMDDFGTGFSSLNYLWRFPFDKIKIDRSFLQNLRHADASIEMIVRTIVNLGHSLDMRVTVEGVEDMVALELVRDLKCDEVQGFYLGRPMPADDVAAALKAGAAPGGRRMLSLAG
ncbi:MAG TPA: EAL domain-containing protein [Xanthobacteraceae bacterium]|nr:EAL domain-containing protein [Xanthobacteraceae bacterium]